MVNVDEDGFAPRRVAAALVSFGTRLRLHPLAVLLTVATATMLLGVPGLPAAADPAGGEP